MFSEMVAGKNVAHLHLALKVINGQIILYYYLMRYYIKVAIEHFAFGLVIPISIIWKLQNGIDLPTAVATEALILAVTAFAEVPAGFLADRWGNKVALVMGGFFHLGSLVLVAMGGDVLMFSVAAILSGLGWAFISGADEAYLHDDLLENGKGYQRSFANVSIADEAGTLLGMVASSLILLSVRNIQPIFIGASVIMLIAILFLIFFLPRGSSTASQSHTPSFTRYVWRDAWKIAPLLIAFSVIYEAGRPLWQPQLQNAGLDIAGLGLVFAFLKLISIAGSFAARGQMVTTRKLSVVLTVLTASLVIFGTQPLVISSLALAIFLFTENYFRVYMSVTLNKVITKNRAAMLSLGSLTRNLAGGIIIAAAGLISANSIMIALVFLAVIKIPGILYLLAYHRRSIIPS